MHVKFVCEIVNVVMYIVVDLEVNVIGSYEYHHLGCFLF